MVLILYTLFGGMTDERFQSYLDSVPASIQKRINRFKKWEDRHASLLGKLLLLEGLKLFETNKLDLDNLQYDSHNRPYFEKNEIDFNISHSGNAVVCALSDDMKLGIDIEEKISRDLDAFKSQLSGAEWDIIQSADNRCEEFYGLWTKKEAIIKACGQGLTFPLKNISVEKDNGYIDDGHWFLEEVDIEPGYACCIAFERRPNDIIIKEVFF